MTEELLNINALNKSFGELAVLKGISLSLNKGEMLFLLGQSGCGKTTLLRSIAGFERADSGEIYLRGKPIFAKEVNVATQQRALGYVVQEGVLFPHLSVYRNIAYGLGNGKGKLAEEKARIQQVMELTGIADLADRFPHQLSGGQQQRVALARAIAPDPDLILLDEPFSALDEHLKQQIRHEMLAVLRRSGKSAIFVTHDREEALRYADKIAIMDKGRLCQIGTPHELYWQPEDLNIATFIGEHISLPATLEENGQYAQSALGRVPVKAKGLQNVSIGTLLFRPEQFVLFANLPANQTACFTAQISQITPKGRCRELTLDINGVSLKLENHHNLALKLGDSLPVSLIGEGLFYAEDLSA